MLHGSACNAVPVAFELKISSGSPKETIYRAVVCSMLAVATSGVRMPAAAHVVCPKAHCSTAVL